MKIFHISDLHIGKLLYRYSLAQSQRAVLGEIAALMEEHRPDVLVIAGDIYDKTAPSGDACAIFDEFLNRLGSITPGIPALIIGGNHDSGQRLSFAGEFLKKHQIYVSAMPPLTEEEHLTKVTLEDAWGEVDFYLLPFLKPGYVRGLFSEGIGTDYTGAVKAVLDREKIDFTRRNVVISHQFYQGSRAVETCDSEQAVLNVGGLDKVDVSVLEPFDYAALGHLHGAQQVQYAYVRYSGTPLKYSVSEENHKKGITVAELGRKGEPVQISRLPLGSLRNVRSLRGTLEEVLGQATEENRHDYVSVTLTDPLDPARPRERLEEVYDYLLELRIDNARTRARLWEDVGSREGQMPREAFWNFYQEMNQCPMTAAEEAIMDEVFEAAGAGGEEEPE